MNFYKYEMPQCVYTKIMQADVKMKSYVLNIYFGKSDSVSHY